MSKILVTVAWALLAAAAAAQTPKELLEMTRGEFDGLAATATVRFEGRDWSKSDLVKELDRRAKGPGAIPRGKDVNITPTKRSEVGGALKATRSKGTSTFGPETISALKAWRSTDPPFIAYPSSWGIATWWGDYCGDGNRYVAAGAGFDGSLSAKLFGLFPGGSVSLGVVKVPPPPSVNLHGAPPGDPNLDYLELTLPCGISGVGEHRASLRIYANGVSSDDVPIDFVPARAQAKAAPSWVTQSIAATADSNVKLTPGHGDAPAWCKDSFGAKHWDQQMAYGVDTFKVVVPGSCTLVGADLRWDTVNGQESPGTWVIEKRHSLSGNTLEIELMWGTFGSGLVYGIEPRVTTIAGFPCT